MEHINASVQKLFDSETNDNLYDSYALYRNYATHLWACIICTETTFEKRSSHKEKRILAVFDIYNGDECSISLTNIYHLSFCEFG